MKMNCLTSLPAWSTHVSSEQESIAAQRECGGALWSDYLLRHAVVHADLSQNLGLLEGTLRDSDFWRQAFLSGHGPCLLRDISRITASSDLARDLVRWGRSHLDYLVRFPRAALQLACDSPSRRKHGVSSCGQDTAPSCRLVNQSDGGRPLWEWRSRAEDGHEGGRVTCLDWNVGASMVRRNDGGGR